MTVDGRRPDRSLVLGTLASLLVLAFGGLAFVGAVGLPGVEPGYVPVVASRAVRYAVVAVPLLYAVTRRPGWRWIAAAGAALVVVTPVVEQLFFLATGGADGVGVWTVTSFLVYRLEPVVLFLGVAAAVRGLADWRAGGRGSPPTVFLGTAAIVAVPAVIEVGYEVRDVLATAPEGLVIGLALAPLGQLESFVMRLTAVVVLVWIADRGVGARRLVGGLAGLSTVVLGILAFRVVTGLVLFGTPARPVAWFLGYVQVLFANLLILLFVVGLVAGLAVAMPEGHRSADESRPVPA